ncbi:MAG: hypothetical protein ACYC61_19065 [Isosphaeraceae bacterium]
MTEDETYVGKVTRCMHPNPVQGRWGGASPRGLAVIERSGPRPPRSPSGVGSP